jgi:hypothetical protein
MLVIVSDTHLSDNTTGTMIDAGAFKIFRDTLRDMAYDASWHDGKYQPIAVIELVLLGDILDIIRSRHWLRRPDVKPWTDSSQDEFIDTVEEITHDILAENRESLKVLRELDIESYVTIPPATADGRVESVPWEPLAPRRHRVLVRRHYLVGNHDWFFHLPGPRYDRIRETLVKELGLANAADQPFPHETSESPELTRISSEHKVFLRHGDIYDSDNYDGDRDRSSLGDAIVVQLLARFPAEVACLGPAVSSECVAGLKEIDNIRPLQMTPVWIAGVVARTCKSREEKAAVKRVWNKMVADFFRIGFVKRHYAPRYWPTLLTWLVSRLLSLNGVSFLLVHWPLKNISASGAPNYRNALSEPSLTPGSTLIIVYGHTHIYELVPLDSTGSFSRPADQIYINSGTWRPYHELAVRHPAQRRFIRYHLITFLAFYKDGERNGRFYETWNGALDADGERPAGHG